MKKLFLVTSLIASVATSSAFAKTEGSYLGIDALYSYTKFNERYTQGSTIVATNLKPSFSDNSFGFGAHYNYAVNLNDFFLSPGIFFERNGILVNDNTGGNSGDARRLEIKRRYGAKLDAGYDITDNFAMYLTGGYSMVSYGTKNFTTLGSGGTRLVNDTVGDWFYGAGFKVDATQNISFNLEYNTQNFAAKTKIPGDQQNYSGIYKTRLDVVKLGISYKF